MDKEAGGDPGPQHQGSGATSTTRERYTLSLNRRLRGATLVRLFTFVASFDTALHTGYALLRAYSGCLEISDFRRETLALVEWVPVQ